MELFQDQFKIRYLVLNINAQMETECRLPYAKASSIRGGFGNCLLDGLCVCPKFKKNCMKCSFYNACIVRNIMYAGLKRPFAASGSMTSEGYMITCTDQRTRFHAGDMLRFSITLFGDVIAYLQPILQAIFGLSSRGIGKEQATFRVCAIKNQHGQDILGQNGINLEHYQFRYLSQTIEERLKQFSFINGNALSIRVRVLTPATVKYHGKVLQSFHATAFLNAAARRVHILNCLEGRQEAVWRIWKDNEPWDVSDDAMCFQESCRSSCSETDQNKSNSDNLPVLETILCKTERIGRYSDTKKQKMYMEGITGEFILHHVTEEMLCYLLAGEVIHTGRHTSFGFGKYIIEPAGRNGDKSPVV